MERWHSWTDSTRRGVTTEKRAGGQQRARNGGDCPATCELKKEVNAWWWGLAVSEPEDVSEREWAG